MYFEGFVNGYLVHTEEWYDGHIYFNVRYFRPGQSMSKPPVFDKTVYITNNEKGRFLVQNYKSTLANHIARIDVKPGNTVVITA